MCGSIRRFLCGTRRRKLGELLTPEYVFYLDDERDELEVTAVGGRCRRRLMPESSLDDQPLESGGETRPEMPATSTESPRCPTCGSLLPASDATMMGCSLDSRRSRAVITPLSVSSDKLLEEQGYSVSRGVRALALVAR